jgi:hypothetical protein
VQVVEEEILASADEEEDAPPEEEAELEFPLAPWQRKLEYARTLQAHIAGGMLERRSRKRPVEVFHRTDLIVTLHVLLMSISWNCRTRSPRKRAPTSAGKVSTSRCATIIWKMTKRSRKRQHRPSLLGYVYRT